MKLVKTIGGQIALGLVVLIILIGMAPSCSTTPSTTGGQTSI